MRTDIDHEHPPLPDQLRPAGSPARVVRAHVFDPPTLARAITAASFWDERVRVLKVGRDRAVLRATVPLATLDERGAPGIADADAVIKVFAQRGAGDRFAQLTARSRAHREWAGLWRLANAGVRAATPYALLACRARGGGTIHLLIARWVPGSDLLRVWADGSLAGERARGTLGRVGRQVADLGRASTPLFNRDHKPSNIVIDPDGEPVMIDAAGIRHAGLRAAMLGRAWRQRPVAMLAKLWIETLGVHAAHPDLLLPSRADRWRVVRGYCARALGGWALATPASRRASCKAAWRAASRLVAAHGDPTPADDPLGEAFSGPTPQPASPPRDHARRYPDPA